jgi:hypothetical protein
MYYALTGAAPNLFQIEVDTRTTSTKNRNIERPPWSTNRSVAAQSNPGTRRLDQRELFSGMASSALKLILLASWQYSALMESDDR